MSGQYRGVSCSKTSVTDHGGIEDVWTPVAFFRVNARSTLYRSLEKVTGNMTDASRGDTLSFLCGAVIAKWAPTL